MIFLTSLLRIYDEVLYFTPAYEAMKEKYDSLETTDAREAFMAEQRLLMKEITDVCSRSVSILPSSAFHHRIVAACRDMRTMGEETIRRSGQATI